VAILLIVRGGCVLSERVELLIGVFSVYFVYWVD